MQNKVNINLINSQIKLKAVRLTNFLMINYKKYKSKPFNNKWNKKMIK